MKYLANFFKPKQPKVWAVYEYVGGWVKVVSYEEPAVLFEQYRRGPFRSEVDCEEFCKAANSKIERSAEQRTNQK